MKRYRAEISRSTQKMLTEIMEEFDIKNIGDAITMCVSSVHDNLKSGNLSSLEELNPTQQKLNEILEKLDIIFPETF